MIRPSAPEVVRIVAVCTGNVCRSPLAEQLLRARLGTETGVEIASAGLAAPAGASMDPTSSEWSRRLGGDPRAAVAKQLGPELIDGATVLLTMTAAQRDDLVRTFPAALLRTFTLVEFARLITANAPEGGVTSPRGWVDLVQQCSRLRHQAVLSPQDDVLDPIGGDDRTHERVAREIDGAVEAICGAVLGR